MARNRPKRIYEVWRGNNKFWCGGRLIFGPDVVSVFLSTALILAPAIAFCINTYLKTKWYPIAAVGAILTIFDLIFLFLTSARDPGIVPRNARPPELDEALDSANTSIEWVSGRSGTPHPKLPRIKDVMVNGILVKVKYCDTCLLYRPPRASHCSICNNCVQRFDHHCPWVGQCIGARNYRFYYMFISTSTTLCIYIHALCWISLLHQNKNLLKSMSRDILSDILIIYTFVCVWFVGGLSVFHFYLFGTNQTTYENFRYRYDKKENPYNKGFLRNFKEVFFSKIPPSLNNFRATAPREEPSVALPSIPPTQFEVAESPKEKIDIEMGSFAESDISLPMILRNLEFDNLEDNLKGKEGGEDAVSSPLVVDVSCDDQEDVSRSLHNSVVEDVYNSDEKSGQMSETCEQETETHRQESLLLSGTNNKEAH